MRTPQVAAPWSKHGADDHEDTMDCKCPDMIIVEQEKIYKLEAVVKAADNMRTKQFSGASVETLRKALESYHTYILNPRFD
jgi:hypothetical protein